MASTTVAPRNTPRPSAAALAAATPDSRDRYLDLLRVLAIGVVVLGHWLMATVAVAPDGGIRTGNVLADVPAAQLLTWVFQVMPLFFLVGGAAHALVLRRDQGYPGFLVGRLHRLLAPTAVLLAGWVALSAAVELLGGEHPSGAAEVFQIASRTVVQPLWFIGVYLGLVAVAPAMYRAHRRWGAGVLVVLLGFAAVVDVLRFGAVTGHPIAAAGALNVAVVWLAVHQLGFFYVDGRLTRRAGAALAAGGLAAVVVLTVGTGWYPVSMVGLPGAPTSNMNPPTLALAAHAGWLIGAALLLRPVVTRWLRRPRVWTAVVAGNGMVMTVFLWHLTALFLLAGGLIAAGVTLPAPASGPWWLTRPLWLAGAALVTAGLVAAFRRFEGPATPRPRHVASTVPGPLRSVAAAVGAALATTGMLAVAVTGLSGMLSGHTATLVVVPVSAVAGLALLAGGWALVRAADR